MDWHLVDSQSKEDIAEVHKQIERFARVTVTFKSQGEPNTIFKNLSLIFSYLYLSKNPI